MKRLIYSITFTILALGLQPFLPWWILPIIAIALSFGFGLKPLPAFLLSFLLAALLWGGHAAYIDHLNDSMLSTRMGDLFGGLSSITMIVITGIFGGLFAGIGGLVGSIGRSLTPGEL